jgi:probable rRNA maturation factor
MMHALLAKLKIEQAELGVYFVTAPEMTRLNETFLEHHGPTDVITFDYSDKKAQTRASKTRQNRAVASATAKLHGEIFVCVHEAVLQARRFRTTWQAELVRYIVHGVLHLCGFNDTHPVARRKMKRAENELLRQMTGQFALRK